MYVLSINGLVRHLARDGLSQKASLIYLMMIAVAYLISIESARVSPYTLDFASYVMVCVKNLITILMIFVAYKINKASSGESFLDRFVSIYTVLSIRFFLFSLGFLAICFVLIGVLGIDIGIAIDPMDENYIRDTNAYWMTYEAILFWRMCVHFKRLQRKLLEA